eukprot:GHRR01026061.1.p1 GENE.GHRR01026061.1~~GHRR01026061.1.p1  ORF type:complete len:114 (-),score=21.40 GHRR01026061.1:147-488(-)
MGCAAAFPQHVRGDCHATVLVSVYFTCLSIVCCQDRVETSPEQIAACSALAEHISTNTAVPTRIVGWYHSHPHITVLPSHVDVKTQVSGCSGALAQLSWWGPGMRVVVTVCCE